MATTLQRVVSSRSENDQKGECCPVYLSEQLIITSKAVDNVEKL